MNSQCDLPPQWKFRARIWTIDAYPAKITMSMALDELFDASNAVLKPVLQYQKLASLTDKVMFGQAKYLFAAREVLIVCPFFSWFRDPQGIWPDDKSDTGRDSWAGLLHITGSRTGKLTHFAGWLDAGLHSFVCGIRNIWPDPLDGWQALYGWSGSLRFD